MLLTWVALGVGWEPEVGVGDSRGKEEIQENRGKKRVPLLLYRYIKLYMCVYEQRK